MKGLFVRVGADTTEAGGWWNGPVDSKTHDFVYAAIWEKNCRKGYETPFSYLEKPLAKFGLKVPEHLRKQNMHLDPDFRYLTYGDQGSRAKQLSKLEKGDLLVFYASLHDVHRPRSLVYAIIGIYFIDRIIPASSIPRSKWHMNAHLRYKWDPSPDDRVVYARRKGSGRLKQCLRIGSFRNRAYRVLPSLLKEWGGLHVKAGYLQRSAYLQKLKDARRFYEWFQKQDVHLIKRNN